jgi:CheY-like chemotaxis protein
MDDTRKTVLVIDDQEDERAIQSAMLGHLGYRVREASDGKAGVESADRSPPDLILLDVAMPRMDGFQVCRILRSNPRTRSIPILIYTASVVGDVDVIAREAGADGVLAKPVDPRAVVAAVQRLIGPATE